MWDSAGCRTLSVSVSLSTILKRKGNSRVDRRRKKRVMEVNKSNFVIIVGNICRVQEDLCTQKALVEPGKLSTQLTYSED